MSAMQGMPGMSAMQGMPSMSAMNLQQYPQLSYGNNLSELYNNSESQPLQQSQQFQQLPQQIQQSQQFQQLPQQQFQQLPQQQFQQLPQQKINSNQIGGSEEYNEFENIDQNINQEGGGKVRPIVDKIPNRFFF